MTFFPRAFKPTTLDTRNTVHETSVSSSTRLTLPQQLRVVGDTSEGGF